MSSRHMIEELRSREATFEEESAALDDDDLMDSMNLDIERTGIEGTIFISTAMGRHGPRVKYYEKPGKRQPSFSVSIADDPAVLASSLSDRIVRRLSPQVIAWVRLNRPALLDFWDDGGSWSEKQVESFKAGLRRV